MPITTSAIKKAKQDKDARKRNRVVINAYKKSIKNIKKLVIAGEKKKAQDELRNAYSTIDRAAKKNIIHKNNAARKKAFLSKMVRDISSNNVGTAKKSK